MQHYSSSAFTDIGKAAGGATITVKVAGTLTNASIFSDDGVTPKSNPFTANSLGQFDFYAASGKYDITISGTQITTYTQTNQVVFDPFEQSAADTGVLLRSLSLVTPFGFSTGLTVPSGQVLNADQVMPFNSSQTGGFWGVGVNFPSFQAAPTTGVLVAQPNEVRVFQFTLPFSVTIGRVTLEIFNFGNSTTDIGLYNSAGNRILYTGGFGTGSAGAINPAILGAPVLVPAGVYYFAQTSTNNVITFRQLTGYLGTIFGATNAQRYGIAANAATNGVLPTSLGSFGLFTASQSVFPALAFFER